jgi:dipeptidyl-peptidase-4
LSQLTVERLFADPTLTGTLPGSLTFSPDGTCVAFLRAADDDRERLDLWRYDIAAQRTRCWLDARKLSQPNAVLTTAEKAERERKRQFSRGITGFAFSPDGNQLLFGVDGTGHLLALADNRLTTFTPDGTRQTDFRFSPGGHYISYVRGNNLYYHDLVAQTEVQVTGDGSALVSNGIADFIAAEEMHRFDGHWWAPDESAIAYTRVDESPIAASQRYEIDADEFKVIEQRYPYAGAANADVRLRIYFLTGQRHQDVNCANAPDDYLARVDWAGDKLAIQVQSRNQQLLEMKFYDPASNDSRSVLTERSDTWINLHDNFRSIDGDRFVWTSERDGHAHIYLYSNGEPHQLTRGPGHVNSIVHADGQRVLFTGWLENPTEQHLYAAPLDGSAVQKLTNSPGWHEATVDASGGQYLDRATSLIDPGNVALTNLETGERRTIANLAINEHHPYFPYSDRHITPELGELKAADGQVLHYRLTRPANTSAPQPLIVHVYGGPGVQRVRNEWAPLTLQLFAQRGFGVLELDNRGSSNRGRAFEDPIYRQMGDAEVRDQITGAKYAQRLDWVDSNRIGVFGHSYGGFMTLMCLARAPDIFKAGVCVAPVTDWRLYDTHYTERYLSTPRDNEHGYAVSSVFSHLEKIQGKLLLMHGMADDNVLFTNTTKLMKALQAQNTQFELMTYPGSKHALQEPEVSVHRYTLILDFFARSL